MSKNTNSNSSPVNTIPACKHEDIWNEIKGLKLSIVSLKTELTTCKKKLEKQKSINTRLEEQMSLIILDMEAATVQNTKNEIIVKEKNIIIYGIDHNEEKPKNAPPLEDLVTSTLKKYLGVTTKPASVRRLGKQKNNTPAPVLIQLPDMEIKRKIFRNISKLKNTPIAIQEDLPLRVRERRKHLLPHYKRQQRQGNKVHWREDKIFVNGTYFDPTIQIPESTRATNTTTASSSVHNKDSEELAREMIRGFEERMMTKFSLMEEPFNSKFRGT
jgi:hypothetical protein